MVASLITTLPVPEWEREREALSQPKPIASVSSRVRAPGVRQSWWWYTFWAAYAQPPDAYAGSQ